LVEADIGYILHILPESGRRYDPVSVGDKGVMLLLQLIICINGIIYSVITILHTNVYKYLNKIKGYLFSILSLSGPSSDSTLSGSPDNGPDKDYLFSSLM
jgi:hypothetical protein